MSASHGRVMQGWVIQGWCPGALRPMASEDGLILRIRPPAGRLTHVQVEGVAELAEAFGNGLIELTRRANVQLRGLSPQSLPEVQRRLVSLELLDPRLDAETEARVNILLNPFLDNGTHSEPGEDVGLHLWTKLRSALTAPDAPRLPAKFGFAIDLSPEGRHLADESADIRIESGADHPILVRGDGAGTGRPAATPAEAVELALALAHWFVASGGVAPDGRGRMRNHLARGAVPPQHLRGTARPAPAAVPEVFLARVVGFDFGTVRAATFTRLPHHIPGPIHLTPWRGVTGRTILDRETLQTDPDVILDASDPRHRRFACVGKAGCGQALGDPRALARRHRLLPPPGASVHIAGCAKGCAHPGPADVTLTCIDRGLLLSRSGRAGDGRRATLDQIKALLRTDPDAL